MAEIGKVRIRIPSSIKRGDVVRVRSLVIHPMEIVQRDKAGKPVDRNYHFINKVSVTYNGREICQADTTQSTRETPVRYKGRPPPDFGEFRPYAYDDSRPEPRIGKIPLPAAKGDPKEGRKLFMARAKGPCTGCHPIPGDDVWPAGHGGPA